MKRIKITKYVLLIEKGHVYLRFYTDDEQFVKGYCNTHCCKIVNGKSLPGLRKLGARMAKLNETIFEDRT